MFREESRDCFEQGLDSAVCFCCADILDVHETEPFDLILCNGLLGGPILNGREQMDTAVGSLVRLLAPPAFLTAVAFVPGVRVARLAALGVALAIPFLRELGVSPLLTAAWSAVWLLVALGAGVPEGAARRPLAARRHGLETGTVYANRCDYLDPGLAWTGVKDTGRGASLSRIGYEMLTRPKSYHLREVP